MKSCKIIPKSNPLTKTLLLVCAKEKNSALYALPAKYLRSHANIEPQRQQTKREFPQPPSPPRRRTLLYGFRTEPYATSLFEKDAGKFKLHSKHTYLHTCFFLDHILHIPAYATKVGFCRHDNDSLSIFQMMLHKPSSYSQRWRRILQFFPGKIMDTNRASFRNNNVSLRVNRSIVFLKRSISCQIRQIRIWSSSGRLTKSKNDNRRMGHDSLLIPESYEGTRSILSDSSAKNVIIQSLKFTCVNDRLAPITIRARVHNKNTVMTTIAENKRARFDYELLETIEAGIALLGHEVKSVKTGHVSLQGSFVTLRGDELFLTNALIPFYTHAGDPGSYDPTRPRQLLVKRSEAKRLIGKVRVHGLTLIPLRVYTKRHLVKVLFAVAKGKKEYDKRQTTMKREAKRKADRAMRGSPRLNNQ